MKKYYCAILLDMILDRPLRAQTVLHRLVFLFVLACMLIRRGTLRSGCLSYTLTHTSPWAPWAMRSPRCLPPPESTFHWTRNMQTGYSLCNCSAEPTLAWSRSGSPPAWLGGLPRGWLLRGALGRVCLPPALLQACPVDRLCGLLHLCPLCWSVLALGDVSCKASYA